MGLHGVLLLLEDSGVETTRYALSCTNHAKNFQALFKTIIPQNFGDLNFFIINALSTKIRVFLRCEKAAHLRSRAACECYE
jgi:hypothetical protein